MADLFVYYGKSGTKYPAVECECVVCGKTFLRGIRWLKRTPVSTCSKECNKVYHARCKQAEEERQLATWLAENHQCATCGKIMTSKFGTGIFCSRACANSRQHSAETRSKIAQSTLAFYDLASSELAISTTCLPLQQHYQAVSNYDANPKYCVICNTKLPYAKRKHQTCSKSCKNKLASSNAIKNHNGGLTVGGGPKNTKHGRYKGFNCDSIYELVFVIYCLDHNIQFVRNTDYFNYTFEGKIRKYYPDFYLPDSDTYLELKGYKDTKVDLKLQAVEAAGKNINILYKKDLLPYFEYVGKTYNKKYNPDYNNIEELYEERW